MNNDPTPRRGAVRSQPRPLSTRPVPAMARQVQGQSPSSEPIAQIVTPSSVPVAPTPQPVTPPAPTPTHVAPLESTPSTSAAMPAPLPTQPIGLVAVPAPTAPKVKLPEPLTRQIHDTVLPAAPPQLAKSSLQRSPALPPLEKKDTATPAAAPKPKQPKRKWYQFSKKSFFVSLLLVSALGATSYIGVDAWLSNNQLNVQLGPVAQAIQPGQKAQANEGTETTKVPDESLASYTVAADVPRILTIDTLGVAARVLPMGVNEDNSMQAPTNINDSGWYTGSAKPGVPGAVVIDGHASASNAAVARGLFNSLGTLNSGDIITIEKGDGTKISYTVVFKETVALDTIDMQKAMQPYGTATEGLNLITCAGQWTDSGDTLDHRTVVYAERIA